MSTQLTPDVKLMLIAMYLRWLIWRIDITHDSYLLDNCNNCNDSTGGA